jgi:hypothetical protein
MARMKRKISFLFNLECWGPNEAGLVFIRLVQTPSGYVRHCADTVTCLPWKDAEKLQGGPRKEIYISKTMTPTISESLTKRLRCGYYAEIHNQTRYSCTLARKFPTSLWNVQKRCFMIGPNEEFTGLLELPISVDLDPEVEGSREKQLYGVLKWPRVFVLLDNLAGGGSAHPTNGNLGQSYCLIARKIASQTGPLNAISTSYQLYVQYTNMILGQQVVLPIHWLFLLWFGGGHCILYQS